MTHVIRDSFSPYATVADAGQNYWPGLAAQTSLTTNTRFGVGQALALGNSNTTASLTGKVTYATNEPNNFVGMYINPNFVLTGTKVQWGIRWFDGSTVQASAYFVNNGNINFYRGDQGTLLGTYSAAFSGQAFTQLQIECIVDGTSGEFHVRKNGNTSDDYTLTGVNNRSSANNYANGVDFNGAGGASGISGWIVGDVWIWNGGTGFPNTWIGDFKSQYLPPTADSAVQFTQSPTNPQQTLGGTATTRSFAANTMATLGAFTAEITGTISSIACSLNAGITGHVNLGLYDNTGAGGAPGALIATATALTNPVTGTITFTFSSPPSVTQNSIYWPVLLNDVTTVLKAVTGNVQQYTQSQTYGSGFTNPMTPVSASTTVPSQVITYTPAGNFAMVSELHEDQNTTVVLDSTVGDKDLYTSAGLVTTPQAILGLSLRVFGCKSDAGARSGQPTMTSGSTVQDGTSVALSTTFENLVQVQDTDPATGVAWTASGINNLKFGQKVSA